MAIVASAAVTIHILVIIQLILLLAFVSNDACSALPAQASKF
jgi:hypothetical protein